MVTPTPAPPLTEYPIAGTSLRAEAEARLASTPATLEPTAKLVHELQVHQIELELQNAELQRAQLALQAAHDAYFDLFERAPVGYLTLDGEGWITSANLTAARLLGEDRSHLLRQPFARWLPDDTERRHWQELFRDLLTPAAGLDPAPTGHKVEMVLRRDDGSRFPVLLDGLSRVRAEEPPGLRIALTDISVLQQAQQAQRDSETRLRALFETSGNALMLLDRQAFLDCNPAALRLFGCASRADFLGLHPAQLSPPTQPGGTVSRALADQRIETAFRQGSHRFEWRYCRLDGTEFTAEVLLTALELEGKPVLQAAMHDISQRKQLEAAVLASRNTLQLLLDTMAEGVFGVDLHGHCTFVNQALLRLLGYASPEEFLGRPIHALVHHSHPDGSPYPAAECRLRGSYQLNQSVLVTDEVFWRKDGRAIPVEYRAEPLLVEGSVVGAIVTFLDISERLDAEATIHELAFHDSLTQLPNRRLLADRLEQALAASARSGRYGAVLFMDLDHFKELNDAHGHAAGDGLLLAAAQRLQGCVRKTDTVARYGGDEFVVVLCALGEDLDTARAVAGRIAEKIREVLAQPYRLTSGQGHPAGAHIECLCPASMGVALFRNHTDSADVILSHADRAMYRAKADGRNPIRWHVDEPSQTAPTTER